MPTVPLESEKHPPAVTTLDGSLIRRPLMPAIRWGAILAGVVVGISVQLALTLLGIATGLSSSQAVQSEELKIGSMIWAGVSMLIAAFVGAYVAARMSGLKRKADGILHGVVSWAVTTLLFAVLATSAAGLMLDNLFDRMVPNLEQEESAQKSATPQQAGPVETFLVKQLGEDATPAQLRRILRHVHAGDRDRVVQYMTDNMAIARLRAENIADQALILNDAQGFASPRAQAEAERAVGAANIAAWIVFTVVALSLALGIIGGALGAHGSRRTTWGSTAGPLPSS